MKLLFDSIFFSYAQIFFSNRRWVGALALIGTFVCPEIGLLSLLGVTISNMVAMYLKFDKSKIESGFYGFNGILIGAAAGYYYQLSMLLLMLILVFIFISFLLSAMLENYMAVAFNLPGLSLPFVIAAFIFVIFLSNYSTMKSASIHSIDEKWFLWLPPLVKLYFKSLALILFQPGIITGILLALTILFFSRVLFSISIIAFILSQVLLGWILPENNNQLALTVAFNAILTAFALGGSLVLPCRKSIVLVTISTVFVIIFTGFFHRALLYTGLPVLVLPFNFIVLATLYSLKFRQDQSELVLLYFSPGSPEENYYYHQSRTARFSKFKFMFPELPFFGEWFVSQGFDGQYTHKGDWKHAFDFIIKDDDKCEYQRKGSDVEDYYCYKIPVAAVLDGKVVRVVDGIPDNSVGNVNIEKNWGNTIILEHEQGLYSSYSHLADGTIKVHEGDSIEKGDIIAACGSSGRSPVPHLHFQFQVTDRLGEKTHKFPFANYLVKHDDKFTLASFSYPQEGETVKNIEPHKNIKKAFDFKYADKLQFEFINANGEKVEEEWEIDVDITNNLFIKSNQNSIAYIFTSANVFYIQSFSGNKNSALYYFALIAPRIPLCFLDNLHWTDDYSLNMFPYSFSKILSQFFLFAKSYISAQGEFSFSEQDESSLRYRVNASIAVKGNGIFGFVQNLSNGFLVINKNGNIETIEFEDEKKKKITIKNLTGRK
ncbi:MAG: urea transporter [Ignavibacteria bacterium]|nr:urea transporter [Ignavibacteria bacterium]